MDEDKDLLLEDLDDGLDLEDTSGDVADDIGDSIPKERVSKIIQQRLAKERAKTGRLYEDFRSVYGVSPEEAVTMGRNQKPSSVQQFVQPTQQPVQQAPQEGAQTDPLLQYDPLAQKVASLEAKFRETEEARRREIEAAEFLKTFPNVKFNEIPADVLNRRANGGVTLTEAYRLYTLDKQVADAARQAAETTARNIRSRNSVRVEGADYGGGAGDTTGSLTDEERQFARIYGMSPKDYVGYKSRLAKGRDV